MMAVPCPWLLGIVFGRQLGGVVNSGKSKVCGHNFEFWAFAFIFVLGTMQCLKN